MSKTSDEAIPLQEQGGTGLRQGDYKNKLSSKHLKAGGPVV